ncbi:hypothetical protein [Mycobacteroides abscessus]|uniref:hypothetical protein n=1 Tax=Mycobacteroides abscessus TaxID=36809 RepID=UPI002FCC61F3
MHDFVSMKLNVRTHPELPGEDYLELSQLTLKLLKLIAGQDDATHVVVIFAVRLVNESVQPDREYSSVGVELVIRHATRH